MRLYFCNLLYAALLVICCFFSIEASAARVEKKAFDRGLIVLSGTSMTNAMHEILKDFSRKNNISVSSTFAPTEELANIIEDGQPANVIVSEAPERMKNLEQKGVLNISSLSDIVSDQLVVVMSKKHYLLSKVEKIKTVEKLLGYLLDNSIMAVPDYNSDPAGIYINQVFGALGLREKSDSRTIKTDSNRRALYLAANARNTAIVYRSDVYGRDDIAVISQIPQRYYDRIIYQASIVVDISSDSHIEDSQNFLSFLKSEQAFKVFSKYGFEKI